MSTALAIDNRTLSIAGQLRFFGQLQAAKKPCSRFDSGWLRTVMWEWCLTATTEICHPCSGLSSDVFATRTGRSATDHPKVAPMATRAVAILADSARRSEVAVGCAEAPNRRKSNAKGSGQQRSGFSLAPAQAGAEFLPPLLAPLTCIDPVKVAFIVEQSLAG